MSSSVPEKKAFPAAEVKLLSVKRITVFAAMSFHSTKLNESLASEVTPRTWMSPTDREVCARNVLRLGSVIARINIKPLMIETLLVSAFGETLGGKGAFMHRHNWT